jgi:hypothetical protein
MTVRQWRRLHRDINRDVRFTTLRAEYRPVYMQLLVELEDDGRLPRVPTLSLTKQIADLIHLPEQLVTKALPVLAQRGLLALEENEGVHVVKFPRRQGLESFDEEFATTAHQSGPKSDAERAKAYRDRKRERNGLRDDRHEERDGASRDVSRVSLRLPSQNSEEKIETEREKDARELSRDDRHETRDESVTTKPKPPPPPVQPELPRLAPAVRCPTVEHARAFEPDEALTRLQKASQGAPRGLLGKMASAQQLELLANVACTASPPLTYDDFDLLGRAWKAGAALPFMKTAPPLGQLLRDGADFLMRGMSDSFEWRESQRRLPPVSVHPSQLARMGNASPMSLSDLPADQRQAIAAGLMDRVKAAREQASQKRLSEAGRAAALTCTVNDRDGG